jgi:acetyl esterase/lipase
LDIKYSRVEFYLLWMQLVVFLVIAFAACTQNYSERIPLWTGSAPVSEGISDTAKAFITVYQPARASGAAIVICPGGGYGKLVKKPEGDEIAKWLNQHNIVGVVLEYRLPNGRPFVPLLDAQRAIRTIRSKASELNIDPNKIGIMGFSAGGHLASLSATHFDSGDSESAENINHTSSRPDFAILIYPVITMGSKTHSGSKLNLLGENPEAEMVELFSSEKQVTFQTPPSFLAHAMDDQSVKPDNSKLFYEALLANNVAAKYLRLPSGGHGLNGYKGPMWDEWQTQLLQWLAELRIISEESTIQ